MKLWALAAVTLIGCADPDPHEIVTCEAGWTDSGGTPGAPVATCEAACADAPVPNETEYEMSCIWSMTPGGPRYCPASRFRDGGCCVPVPDGFDGGQARIALINCFD